MFSRNVLATLALALVSWTAAGEAAPITFAYTGGFQTYTVGVTGRYQIIAAGAQGGSGTRSGYLDGNPFGFTPDFYTGGRGAEIGGDFKLTKGQSLQIAVGGQGQNASSSVDNVGGGGGGGTFVVTSAAQPLVIGGGGGGGGYNQYGGDGRIETSGGSTVVSPFFYTTLNPGVTINGGTNGNGGEHGPLNSGSGGAGFLGDGQGVLGGKAFPNLSGASFNQFYAAGGFGGGGGADEAAGGGGGYSGGAGGYYDFFIAQRQYSGGQGGGSFLADSVLANMDLLQVAGYNSGNGFVTINLVSAVPLPASAPMFGAALLALGAVGYGVKRKKAAAAA